MGKALRGRRRSSAMMVAVFRQFLDKKRRKTFPSVFDLECCSNLTFSLHARTSGSEVYSTVGKQKQMSILVLPLASFSFFDAFRCGDISANGSFVVSWNRRISPIRLNLK
ncbi:hypothetical protein CDAR_239771 [Caerostris darwini]|uniref:Uncharacterized protein n=1 Tax=Caerostris darwini TaxID=1538125 RepID=A0AAV4QWG4_9ARAC|nr:hypothetical protein CDAR_239771 [Caerostris darwini]